MKKWTTFAAITVLGAGATSFALRAQGTPSRYLMPFQKPKPLSTLAIGQKIAPLSLFDPAGKPVTVGDWSKSKATVLIFVATRCPVSNAYNGRMATLNKTYAPQGIKFVGINSNGAENGAEVAQHAKENGLDFAIYKDPHNPVADRFDARVTPEAYVVNSKGKLVYHGRIDNSQNEAQVKEKSLQIALDAVLAGKPVPESETRAFGCSIKREN